MEVVSSSCSLFLKRVYYQKVMGLFVQSEQTAVIIVNPSFSRFVRRPSKILLMAVENIYDGCRIKQIQMIYQWDELRKTRFTPNALLYSALGVNVKSFFTSEKNL